MGKTSEQIGAMRARTGAGVANLNEQVNWPTPTQFETGNTNANQKNGPVSMREALEWPSPTATPYGTSNNGSPHDGRTEYATKGKPSLERMAGDWPTATAQEAVGSGSAGYGKVSVSTGRSRQEGTTLTDAIVGPHGPASRSTSGKRRAQLNPAWVAQLMGFPDGWL